MWGKRQWSVLMSPARLEMLELAESAAPFSISDLARLSGRRASSLYRHVDALVRGGFIVESGKRRAGRRFQAIYRLGPMATGRITDAATGRGGPELVKLARRGFATVTRDIERAIQAGDLPDDATNVRPSWLCFEVTWLDDELRRKLRTLTEKMLDIIAEGRTRRAGRVHRLTVALTPLYRQGVPVE